MTLKECYASLGGDFDSVLGRLRKEQLVEKFVYKFLEDQSFSLFLTSMENGNYGEALRAVHTLKGICQNLSFTKLFEISNTVTAALRENDHQTAISCIPQLSENYHETVRAIGAYRKCREE